MLKLVTFSSRKVGFIGSQMHARLGKNIEQRPTLGNKIVVCCEAIFASSHLFQEAQATLGFACLSVSYLLFGKYKHVIPICHDSIGNSHSMARRAIRCFRFWAKVMAIVIRNSKRDNSIGFLQGHLSRDFVVHLE